MVLPFLATAEWTRGFKNFKHLFGEFKVILKQRTQSPGGALLTIHTHTVADHELETEDSQFFSSSFPFPSQADLMNANSKSFFSSACGTHYYRSSRGSSIRPGLLWSRVDHCEFQAIRPKKTDADERNRPKGESVAFPFLWRYEHGMVWSKTRMRSCRYI